MARQKLSDLYQELDAMTDKADATSHPALSANNVRGPFARWTISGNIQIGSYTSINGPMNARGNVRIGRYCAFGQSVSLLSFNHATDMVNQQVWLQQRLGLRPCHATKGPISIGHNVWIGDKAIVLSGVDVGHGAVIAAGAVVSKSVEPFSIVGGNPARHIKYRFNEKTRNVLLAVKWWDWSFEKMQRNPVFFELAMDDDCDLDVAAIVVE